MILMTACSYPWFQSTIIIFLCNAAVLDSFRIRRLFWTNPKYQNHVLVIICNYIYTHICIYLYIYICVYIYVYIYIYIYVYIYVYIYIGLFTYIYILKCMYVCMYVCVYVCMYVCMYIYIHINSIILSINHHEKVVSLNFSPCLVVKSGNQMN
jgi:hypothetical protein